MIAFNFHGITHVHYLKRFRYLMRLDDDTCLLDPVGFDIFQRMEENGIVYAYKQIFIDSESVVVGLDSFAEHFMSINELKWANAPLRAQAQRISGGQLLSFSTNLEVIDMWRYRSADNLKFLHAVLNSNNIYNRRWGDAPLRFLQAQMFFTNDEVNFMTIIYYHLL